MGVHKVSAFHPFIFQKSGKSTIIRNLSVPRHFVAYLVFISSIRVDPGPRNRGPTSLLALKIRTPVANTGKLRSIGQVPVGTPASSITKTGRHDIAEILLKVALKHQKSKSNHFDKGLQDFKCN
jgi:hypothetical protein